MSNQVPPESDAALSSMWKQVWNKVRAISQEEIRKVFGSSFVGGKFDAAAIAPLTGTLSPSALPPGGTTPVFGASGSTHGTGLVPDPGSVAGTSRALFEDGAWKVPAGGGGGGGFYTLTKPAALSTWTWVNQGSATGADQPYGVNITTPIESTNQRMLMRTLPGTPWTLTAAILMCWSTIAGNAGAGLALRESASGKLIRFTLYGAAPTCQVGTFSDPSTGVANLKIFSNTLFSQPMWLRITDDGTNWTFRIGADGVTWFPIYTCSRNTYITANQIGFLADSGGSGAAALATLISWAGV